MIIVKIKAGIGNQMFQYACGQALFLRQQEKSLIVNKDNNVEDRDLSSILKLDITGYGENNGIDTVRHYSLLPFNIQAKIATDEEIKRLKYPYGMVSKGWRSFKTKVLRQFDIGFKTRIFNAEGSIYLDGFFQTERYFLDYADTIRHDLSLKEPMGPVGQTMVEKISREPESVSLHVRRGDVARYATMNPYAGITTPEYYQAALKYIGDKFKNPHVFIFSDDPKWVVDNINIPYPSTVVSGAGISDYEEIILMSQCHHHIIANSSFSWWGAWLNPNPNKIVITPKQWVKKAQWRHKDTVPKSWIRI